MKNDWKKIWNGREKLDDKIQLTSEELFMRLKELNGFDSVRGGMSYQTFYKQHLDMLYNMTRGNNLTISSVFEIGCGAGATLFMLEKENIKTGGIDYSASLIETAKMVLKTEDLYTGEAVDMKVEPIYDAIVSNSVFGYFIDLNYTQKVLEIAYKKAKYVIALIDIHDEEKKEDCISFQRIKKENYDERYKNLPIQFYSKEFFAEFAKEKNMEIKFTQMNDMEEYWNAPFSYNVYMYK